MGNSIQGSIINSWSETAILLLYKKNLEEMGGVDRQIIDLSLSPVYMGVLEGCLMLKPSLTTNRTKKLNSLL